MLMYIKFWNVYYSNLVMGDMSKFLEAYDKRTKKEKREDM
jgi:hypothetical protein